MYAQRHPLRQFSFEHSKDYTHQRKTRGVYHSPSVKETLYLVLYAFFRLLIQDLASIDEIFQGENGHRAYGGLRRVSVGNNTSEHLSYILSSVILTLNLLSLYSKESKICLPCSLQGYSLQDEVSLASARTSAYGLSP